MIGLKRNTVKVVPHESEWLHLGMTACREIERVAGNLVIDVQHIGSTAVPDLPAKPILDLVAAVSALELIPALIDRLRATGYIYRGDAGSSGGHLFVMEPIPNVRTIHLHVVAHDDVQLTHYIRFRDLLLRNSGLRVRYAELKEELVQRFPHDRTCYTNSKNAFIQDVLNQNASDS